MTLIAGPVALRGAGQHQMSKAVTETDGSRWSAGEKKEKACKSSRRFQASPSEFDRGSGCPSGCRPASDEQRLRVVTLIAGPGCPSGCRQASDEQGS